MATLLQQLQGYTTVVADTGDLDAIARFQPEDATTNPSLILKAVQSGQYDTLLAEIGAAAGADRPADPAIVEQVSDRLLVAMAQRILERVPGRVSLEVSARLSFDTEGTLQKARALCAQLRALGVPQERVLIKIAATWEGIRAAEILEREGIQCNLTLIFNFAQARACAEAGAFLISPFVGRILDWHRKQNPTADFAADQEPGVQSVREIYRYFRTHDYPTVVMGASFRNTGEILALAGCDRLTISPALLEELAASEGALEPCLGGGDEKRPRPAPLCEAQFRWAMNEDPMATEKLAEGIRTFYQDQLALEALIEARLQQLCSEQEEVSHECV